MTIFLVMFKDIGTYVHTHALAKNSQKSINQNVAMHVTNLLTQIEIADD